MYDFVNDELHHIVEKNFSNNIDMKNISIFGHSMGGMGALLSSLKNPGKYKSVSAFAPICHPSGTDVFQNTLIKYLGSVEAVKDYDPVLLAKKYNGPNLKILIHQVSPYHLSVFDSFIISFFQI